MTFSSAPTFATRVPVQFICPDNTALNIDGISKPFLINNPKYFTVSPGSVAKVDLGINGRSYFRGDGEYAPFALVLEWEYLGYNDYLKLAALRPYFVDFITYRGIGYYGKLVMGDFKNAPGVADAVGVKGTFYVLNPSDASGAATINRLPDFTTASSTVAVSTNSGYIPANTAEYYWGTFSSSYGETAPFYIGTVSSTAASTANVITWVWPTTTNYVTKASIYVSNTPYVTNTLLSADILNGQTPIWTDLVGYAQTVIDVQPPTVSTAYRGYWSNGIWMNEP